MSRFQAWLLHGSVVAITITGIVFAWMRYGMTTDDPFAVANHPWQPHMLHLHVLAAPIVVFALGLIFSSHIWPKYESRMKARRRSGLGALWMMVPMVLSGYLIQVVTSEGLLQAMKVTHWVSSGVFVLAYVVHQVLRPRAAIQLQRDEPSEAIVIPVGDDENLSSAARR